MRARAAHIKPFLVLAYLACACHVRSRDASEDYVGLVPALSGSMSCLDAALLAQTLDCQQVPASSFRISVERCSNGSGGGAGLFIMLSKRRWEGEGAKDPQGGSMLGQDVFRIRLVGPEIHLLDILYCDRDLAFAQYALAEPGAYHAEVQHLGAVRAVCAIAPRVLLFSAAA